ncbi:MAG: M15 family metallopeptidase [Candidatus Berkiellales bacterium]
MLLFWVIISNCFAQSTFDSIPINSVISIQALPEYEKRLISDSNLVRCQPLIKELVLVKVRYWGFDDQEHHGALIVHATLGKEVVAIFQELFEQRFPIQAMQPIPANLKKDPSIYDNITGAFYCRDVTDQPGILSQHSYGRAIDINPLINPYVKGCLIIPAGSQKHISRIYPEKGKIMPNSLATNLFARYGWDWGGNFVDCVDYQHFEKRANGEKRDPFGYVSPFTYKINYC